MKKEKYLFFCQHCGVPQEIPTYIITHYLIKSYVDGYFCDYCKNYNAITFDIKSELARLVDYK
jgi:hypothetical protein